MRQKDIDDYGGLKDDESTVVNPQSQTDAAEFGEQVVDLAALTQIPCRAWVNWQSVAVSGLLDPSLVTHASIYGSGSGQKPSVERTGAGLYTVSYTATFPMGYALDPGDDETEIVSFKDALVSCNSSDAADIFSDCRKLTIAGSTVTLCTKANLVLADIGNNSAAPFSVSVWLW